ncbi:MAG: acyl-CoA dehydrogenase family protein [Deltaproteobacteria bacterium]|nr:acyl-CoA dehydrogenase family protein [Deltaproteobacteria bacterium]
MNFALEEHELMVQETARRVAVDHLAPGAKALDESHAFPKENIERLGELGLLGVNIPEQYGGAEAGPVAYSLAMMEVGAACAATGVTMAVTNMVGEIIAAFGTEEQKAKHIPKLTSAEYGAGAFALSEAHCGSDAAALRTKAVLDGDEWVIDGEKMWITSGDVAGVIVVWARTSGTGPKGITCFLVEGGTPGLSAGRPEEKTGQRGSSTVSLTLEGVRVPKSAMLGEEGQGFKIAMMALDGGRIGVASLATGIGRAALEAARTYANDRQAFGKPLADFQAIQWKLADMATELDAARLLALRAAWLKGQGRRFSIEASMAKVFASEKALAACNEAVQIHGGFGYVNEFPVERYLRDVRVTTIYEGTSEIQRLVIARSLLA